MTEKEYNIMFANLVKKMRKCIEDGQGMDDESARTSAIFSENMERIASNKGIKLSSSSLSAITGISAWRCRDIPEWRHHEIARLYLEEKGRNE